MKKLSINVLPQENSFRKKYIIDRKVLFFVQNFELCKITN